MRKIKFRHYDTRLQEMRFSEKHDGEFYINTKGVLYMYAIPRSESGLETEYYKSYNVEQFTGLNDNNGVNIYDGDIVRFDVTRGYNEGEEPHINQIGKVVIEAIGINFGEWDGIWVGNITVIGNVHENPELLKD